MLQQQRFEILFEIGANAIVDGYYREAVSSFTSSLERFHEFVVRVFLEKTSQSDELFQKCWKKVSSQSERQLGAFIFLWASNFGEVPPLLQGSQVNFRNDVVHKGTIPTREKAVTFGDAVLAIIRPMMCSLRERFPQEMQKVTISHLRDKESATDAGKAVSTMWIATIVNLTLKEPGSDLKSLDEHLVDLTGRRNVVSLIPAHASWDGHAPSKA